MMWKRILYPLLVIATFTSCKSLKNMGSGNSTTAARKSPNTSTDPQFIDGIAVTPGTAVTSAHKTANNTRSSKQRTSHTAPDLVLTNFNIEKADWLQLKYAIVLDATVEKLTNLNLLKAINHWWGTRYCYGGSTENCIDCSSLTQYLLRDVYNVDIPRTAKEQYAKSERINLEDLQEGDLVFFNTVGRGITHVGVYILNNKFVHAATSSGVMVSDLNDTYWRPKYRGAGRVIR